VKNPHSRAKDPTHATSEKYLPKIQGANKFYTCGNSFADFLNA
jgi:hypothetical protein